MNKLQRTFGKLMQKVIDHAMGNGLMQEEQAASGERYHAPGIDRLIRRAGAESAVLLKNDGTLPLSKEEEIAVFGRCQIDWFYVGYGSGGDVKAPYEVSLLDGLERAGAAYNKPLAEVYRAWCGSEEHAADHGWWGHWPTHHPEMHLDETVAEQIAKTAKTAVVVIGRAAGEDRENTLTPGSYYLTDEERAMLDTVTKFFRRTVVVLNVGSIMDLAWTEAYGDRLSAILLAWQGGMESGNAVCDVLYGDVNPSGRLSDTIAKRYEDYPSSANFGGEKYNEYAEGVFVGYRHFNTHAPDRVLYPFGFGLHYTTFSVAAEPVRLDADGASVSVTVTNTGSRTGQESVLLWCSAPIGSIEKPARVLAAFGKTGEIAPGASETLTLRSDRKSLASFDEARHAFVLEAGAYRFTANETDAGSFTLPEPELVEQCEAVCVPSVDLAARIQDRLPQEIDKSRVMACTLSDVAEGRAELDAFIAQLSDAELEGLSRGEGMMNSKQGTPGNAGAFGGTVESLRQLGVRPIITSDGPAGLRLMRYASLVPCGTALACTWNTELVRTLYALVGQEMVHYDIDVFLAPGMNIHRNPLCGRNFEYFSEDPLLSGKMAAAVVQGVQSSGRACCPKHFACNNQETKRNTNDSRVSERTLREIYLRNFEICIKEASPLTIMTSYNKINGVWSHYNYDLVTTILRGEWGFTGTVITDWWMQRAKSLEFPKLRDNAYRVRAQVDVLMPGDWGHMAKRYQPDKTLLESLGKDGGITRAELQRTARNVLQLLLKLNGRRKA